MPVPQEFLEILGRFWKQFVGGDAMLSLLVG